MRYKLLLIPLLMMSCSSEKESEKTLIFTSEDDSAVVAIGKADSLYNVRHGSFAGKHGHQGGDAAVHAHQDVDRNRRIKQKEAEGFESRKKAYQESDRQRKERVKRAMKKISEE